MCAENFGPPGNSFLRRLRSRKFRIVPFGSTFLDDQFSGSFRIEAEIEQNPGRDATSISKYAHQEMFCANAFVIESNCFSGCEAKYFLNPGRIWYVTDQLHFWTDTYVFF